MKTLKTIFAAAMALSLAACGSASASSAAASSAASSASSSSSSAQDTETLDSEVMNKGTISVGISTDYPPFESLDNNGNLIGYDVDMINNLAGKMTTEDGTPYKVEFVQLEFDQIISALQTGQVDVGVAAFSYDPERQCLFTDPYYTSSQVVVVNSSSNYQTIDDLAGKLVAAGSATVGYDAAEEQIPDVKMQSGGDYLTQFEMLRTNQIDAVVCDEVVAQGYADNSSDFRILDKKLVEDNLCITVAKGHQAIVDALNAAIKEFVDSGESDALKKQWGLAE